MNPQFFLELAPIFIERIAYGIGLIGVIIIVYGSFSAFYEFCRMLMKKDHRSLQFDDVRQHLMAYMALSLDFFIGKDIIDTFITTSGREELISLVFIVIIRVVLGFSLDKEITSLEKLKRGKLD